MNLKLQQIYQTDAAELLSQSKLPIAVLPNSEELFYWMAREMADTIISAQKERGCAVLIVPVGPVKQYPILANIINEENISLKNVWFINMDEYLDDKLKPISTTNPLSFRGFMNNNFYNLIDKKLIMPKLQRVFPDPQNLTYIDELIEQLGGVDACFGGIGINGHIAFNEPEPVCVEEFLTRETRVLQLSQASRAVNATTTISTGIEEMPNFCVTIGMKNIFSSKTIKLYCFRDWHSAVVRRIVLGEESANFPASILASHQSTFITITKQVANGNHID